MHERPIPDTASSQEESRGGATPPPRGSLSGRLLLAVSNGPPNPENAGCKRRPVPLLLKRGYNGWSPGQIRLRDRSICTANCPICNNSSGGNPLGQTSRKNQKSLQNRDLRRIHRDPGEPWGELLKGIRKFRGPPTYIQQGNPTEALKPTRDSRSAASPSLRRPG